MTRTTNARIAGATFLIYIAAGLASLAVLRRASGSGDVAARLATIASNPTEVGFIVLLGFVQIFSAIVLGITLYALTRDEDGDLAMLGLICRAGEGIVGAVGIPATLALLSLARSAEANTPAAQPLGAYLFRQDIGVSATLFAAGSTFFCWLLLRGRMIPTAMAWLGVGASVLLVATLPMMTAGFLTGPLTMLVWLPMLVFELAFAIWLLTRGVSSVSAAAVSDSG